MVKERRYIQDLSPWNILKIEDIKFLLCEVLWQYWKWKVIWHRQEVYFWWIVERDEWEKYYTH